MVESQNKFCLYCGAVSPHGETYCCDACAILDKGLSTLEDWHLKSSHPETLKNSYDHFDLPHIKEKYVFDKEKNQFHFFVEGLQCSSCVHLIEKIPSYYQECLSSRVNFGTSILVVELTPVAKLSVVMSLLEELGYKPTLIEKSENIHEKYIQDHRADLKRIAVAGAMAAQMMGFAFGIYAGVDGLLLELFKWANFVMFLPILFYSATPLYKGAWNAIRYKVVHIDLPIVVAMLSGFILSTVNLIKGSDAFYYDSTASFIFLILTARYFVKRIQQNYLAPMNLKTLIKDDIYRTSDERVLLAEQIQADDTLIVQAEQTLPVDGVLESDMAWIDLSLFNGESVPKVYSKGMELKAGYKIKAQAIVFTATSSLAHSAINTFYSNSLDQVLRKNTYLNKSDRWAKALILTVFSISLVAFVGFYFMYGFQESFNRVLALLIVACPCALAFGSPLTLSLSYREAQKKGIAIKDANVFEKLNDVKNIFFDKTGTLTQGQLELERSVPDEVSLADQQIILSLEKSSYHPVAFAFRKAWYSTDHQYLQWDKVEEKIGEGIYGWIGGDCYSVVSSPEASPDGRMTVSYYKTTQPYAKAQTVDQLGAVNVEAHIAAGVDGANAADSNAHSVNGDFVNKELIATFYFVDQLRPESKGLVKEFIDKGYEIGLLTGDKKIVAQQIASVCGINPNNVHAEMTAEGKADMMKRYPQSLMIGDGVNDSLALGQSLVGIALQGSQLLSVHSADVQFIKNGLEPLKELFNVQKKAIATLNRNLVIALVYNFIAGFFALAGLINPFIAAILMPISTLIILLSTVYGVRD